jgi:L,D-peptidoglycan transpeptidase YkuD (ErfK/YbiS/YcfS/YnhG family)
MCTLVLAPRARGNDPSLAADRVRAGTEGAAQLVVVTSPTWSSTTATLETFERDGSGAWQPVFGAMPAHVGRRGWRVGEQRGENDGTSPAGTYGIARQSFGLGGDPGVKGSWFDVGDDDWWVSDPGSPYYNTHQVGPPDGRWDPTYGEHLATVGPVAYRWSTFIEFNAPPQGALGSAVFLHLDTGGATAGCVSLGQDDLLAVLRWLDPARAPVIAMGPADYVLTPVAAADTAPPATVAAPTAAAPLPTTTLPTSTTSTTTSTTTTSTTTTSTTTTTSVSTAAVVDASSGGAGWMPVAAGAGVVAAAGGALVWRRRRP